MRKNKLLFLSSLLIVFMWILVFSSCNNDDEDTGNIYSGYIEYIEQETETMGIKVTGQPENTPADMPHIKDVIHINQKDYENYSFKKDQKITFTIISAKSEIAPALYDYSFWTCKIKIFKK